MNMLRTAQRRIEPARRVVAETTEIRVIQLGPRPTTTDDTMTADMVVTGGMAVQAEDTAEEGIPKGHGVGAAARATDLSRACAADLSSSLPPILW